MTNALKIARMENVCQQIRSEMNSTLFAAYQNACKNEDKDEAAYLLRKIRNNLLNETDKECTLDKIMPPAPSDNSFTNWIKWLKEFSKIQTNIWGTYRQQLRDLPAQEGFPFNVIFPEKPGSIDNKYNME